MEWFKAGYWRDQGRWFWRSVMNLRHSRRGRPLLNALTDSLPTHAIPSPRSHRSLDANQYYLPNVPRNRRHFLGFLNLYLIGNKVLTEVLAPSESSREIIISILLLSYRSMLFVLLHQNVAIQSCFKPLILLIIKSWDGKNFLSATD